MRGWWQTATTLAQAITRSDRPRFPRKQAIIHVSHLGSISDIAALHDVRLCLKVVEAVCNGSRH
jgi:hypothetical protein